MARFILLKRDFMSFNRTSYCGDVTTEQLGQSVTLMGWVHRRRDHGGVIFVDLRDRQGLVQVVFHPDQQQAFTEAEQLRNEYVIQVTGMVGHRPEGTVNSTMKTGEIEVVVDELVILNAAKTPPFSVNDDFHEVREEVLLRYRYLDLRRSQSLSRLKLRAKTVQCLRNYLDDHGFIDVETPVLTKSTPEGARDYLVPSRTYPGQFFALPQSPQIFKQMLMVAGLDRYYQVVKCFRDEDLRADRQPEFTQLDVEMSFVDENQVMDLMESMTRHLFKTVLDVSLPDPFPKMNYHESVKRFGTDRPDLRNPLELVDVADLLGEVDFKVFAGPANDAEGRVAVLPVPGGSDLSRKQIDGYTKFVSTYGAKGLAYIKVNDVDAGVAGLQSPIVKFLPEAVLSEILKRCQAKTGDILFFAADKARIVNDSLAALRDQLAKDLGLLSDDWQPLWVVDFPMFERNKGSWTALHHPFTAPSATSVDALKKDPAGDSRSYDIVLNGFEVGGGSIRIDKLDMQMAVFDVLGISEEEAKEKFGHLLEALSYGCPPHGGIAFGVDRLVMLMAGTDSIREVIAFPKTQSAACPLTAAPSVVDFEQLQQLGLKVKKPEVKSTDGQGE